MLDDVTLGKRLRLLMTAAEETQETLAQRSGVSVGTLSNMMRDKTKPRAENVAAVAGALRVEVRALEDDAACVRELARIAGVLDVRVGPLAQSTELAELLASVPPAQRAGLLTMIRGMVQTFVAGAMPRPAPESDPPEPASSHRRPSLARPTDEGDGRRR